MYTHHPHPLPEEAMTPADHFERQWSRAVRLIRIALLIAAVFLGAGLYLIFS